MIRFISNWSLNRFISNWSLCLTVLDNHNSLNRPEIKTIALSLTIITIHLSGTSDTTFSFFRSTITAIVLTKKLS